MTNDEFLLRLNLINDKTRLQILQIIARKGKICACELLKELNISQSTLSHHMKLLADASIVEVEKDGKWCKYTLKNEKICDLAKFLQSICLCSKEDSCTCK